MIETDICIEDEPFTRRLQTLEVVLQNCSEVIWKNNSEKLKKVPDWLRSIRSCLKQKIQLPESMQAASQQKSTNSARKSGKNGLSVVSADVICYSKDDDESLGSSLSEPREGVQKVLTPALTPNGQMVLVDGEGELFMGSAETSSSTMKAPLQIKRFSGGITNELFHVYDESNVPESVVVRVYGKETERVISRSSELFYQSQFLKTYVHGKNFLVYEYLNNYEPLPYEDMGLESEKIADAVAEFQVRATIASKRDRGYCGASTDAENEKESSIPTRYEREENYTLQSFTKWIEQISSPEIQAKVQQEKLETYVEVVERIVKERDDMLSLIQKESGRLAEGVCHNDLLSANIMREKDSRELKIIDFDYAKKNFLLFDLGNHFNEYTGLKCDYEKYFPSDDHIANFVRVYRVSMRKYIELAHQNDCGLEEVFEHERRHFWSNSDDEEEEAIKDSVKLVKWMTLCSHHSWATWSLFQESVSDLDVDFLKYAQQRFEQYLKTKEEFIKDL